MNQKHQQRRGLGRGLGSLIPTASPHPDPVRPSWLGASSDTQASPSDEGASGANGSTRSSAEDPVAQESPAGMVAGAYYADLAIASISPNPRQPRTVFDEEAMAELVHSVKEIGLLQPVVVRRSGDQAYELIMGERRWRAAQEAGLDPIPAIVRQTGDDDLLRDALLENLHRADLNPLEEAAAYQQLLDDFGCTHEQLASRVGRSRPQITNTLRLLKLSPAVQRRVAAGVLSGATLGPCSASMTGTSRTGSPPV